MSRIHLVLLAVWLLLLCAPLSPAAEPDGAADEQTLKTSGVAVDGAGLLDFFRTRTLAEPQRSRVLALIRKLGADEFPDREQASADLVALGATATPLLRQALRDTDVEVARRSEKCLQQIEKTPGNQLAAAAARIAARRKPAGLAEALLA